MKKSILLILLAVAPLVAQNSGKISGFVRDARTLEGIPGVNVTIKDTKMGASTDVDGSFYILRVPPGTYDVSVSIVGYRRVTQQNVQVHVDRTTTIDFAMEEMTLQTAEVVVVATRPDVEREKTSTSEIRRGSCRL